MHHGFEDDLVAGTGISRWGSRTGQIAEITPSGSITQLRPRLRVPTKVERPRSTISTTRPTTPRRGACRTTTAKLSARGRPAADEISEIASRVSPGGMKRSPSGRMLRRTNPKPRDLIEMIPPCGRRRASDAAGRRPRAAPSPLVRGSRPPPRRPGGPRDRCEAAADVTDRDGSVALIGGGRGSDR